ncbi:MAG: sulfatase-like hydrolase/transferase [Bryobacteraceae bacterium]|nr:sulfatase-like hydrolase/transferase [Bryobacteraceae bacterium]
MIHRRTFLGAVAAARLVAEAKPNLLVILTDQYRFSALSCAGNGIVSTPNLDRLARDGAMFENAVTPCPVCVPARTSIHTGKSMHGNQVTSNAAATDTELDCGPSFDNLLAGRGYRTEYYGKYHSPYKLALTYKNKVAYAGARVAGAPSERQQYLAYLDKYSPARPLKSGEVMNKDFQRPYIPAILDGHQTDPGAEPSQGEVYGWLQIPKEHTHAAYTVDEAIHALEGMAGGPFSLTCSIGPPHPPFLNVTPYWGMYPAGEIPLPKNFRHDMTWSPYRERQLRMKKYQNPENIRAGLSIYYGMVKEVDDQVGRLLKKLDDLGLAGNTMVVFTADHGEMMGSHGMGSKMVFYEESVHVPLLLRFPAKIKPAKRIVDPVSTMDLFATVLDYLGAPAPQREGYSLRPLLEGKKPTPPDFRVSEWAGNNVPNFMVRTRDWKLIMAQDPASRARDALFNLKDDPFEMTNLLGEPGDRAKYRKQADELKDRLLAWLARGASPLATGVRDRKLG